jgi:hypothetical protein
VAVAQSRRQRQTIPFETFRGYTAVVYEGHWWLWYLLEKYEEMKNLKSDSFTHMDHHPLLFSLLNQIN